MTPPVVLVHGWGGSFASTWQRSGFTELLRDAGREVIGVDLLGHGTAPKPHEPEAYDDLGARVLDAMPDEPVDAVGFSLGAITLLRLAMDHPGRFHRLVLAGIGRNVLEPDPDSARRIVAALDGTAPETDTHALLFSKYANQPGNDPVALGAIMRRTSRAVPTAEELAAVTCRTLVVIGDKDFAGPGDPLVAALPNATLTVLRNTDHFATPESFGFIDATLEFLDAVPA
ncbi:MAG: alpha/beta fold hydrolase [Ilumatobacteraceae bacterium]|nr:alpha/beta fold hydrolase [Ilumatobacter sp.]